MKYFRIFAVGLILAAVVVSTALAPVTSAVIDYGFSGSFTDPTIQDISSNVSMMQVDGFGVSDLPNFAKDFSASFTSDTGGTGPDSNPPEADVVPNFSGLKVNGPIAIDGDNDGTEDFSIDEDGEFWLNNNIVVDVNNDGDHEFAISNWTGNLTMSWLGIIGRSVVVVDNVLGSLQLYAENNVVIEGTTGVYINPGTLGDGVDIDGDLDVNGDIDITGNITSTGTIGSYYRKYYSSGSTTVTSGSVACNSGDYLVGCSAHAGTDTAIQGTRMSLSTCYGYSVGSKSIRVYAMCFDPEGETSGYQ